MGNRIDFFKRTSVRPSTTIYRWHPDRKSGSSRLSTSSNCIQISHRCPAWRWYRCVIKPVTQRHITETRRIAGPEVVEQAVRVLDVVSNASSDFKLILEPHDFGGCAIEAHGEPLPSSTLKACQGADAILMGMPRPLNSGVKLTNFLRFHRWS